MAVHDTAENGRTEFTKQTIFGSNLCSPDRGIGLLRSVNWNNNRMIIVDNNSCDETKKILRDFRDVVKYELPNAKDKERVVIIPVPENIGTANAVNKALAFRNPDEYFVKMDNDVLIHKHDWLEEMQSVMERQKNIGILGLKRPDLEESPYAINTDQRSRLLMVPHERGQRWRIVEECKQVMGTCTMLNPALLEKVGYFYQMDGLYGFDDSLMCVRSTMAGFLNCFLHGIDIDHIDNGGTEYTDWKAKYAGEILLKYAATEEAYKKGLRPIYENIKQ